MSTKKIADLPLSQLSTQEMLETFIPVSGIESDADELQKINFSTLKSMLLDNRTIEPHEYWRVIFDANNTNAFCGLTDLQFFKANSIANAVTLYPGEAISSGGTASLAFDTTSATAWTVSGTSGGWIGYHFTKAVGIARVRITASQITDQSPRAFRVQYSDDGVAWVDAWSVTGQTGWYSGEVRQFIDSSPVWVDNALDGVAEANKRIWGFYDAPSGILRAGNGFTVTKVATGAYDVVFDAPRATEHYAVLLGSADMGTKKGSTPVVYHTGKTVDGFSIRSYAIQDQASYDPYLSIEVIDADNDTLGGFVDAPIDGNIYSRKNGQWILVGGSGNVERTKASAYVLITYSDPATISAVTIKKGVNVSGVTRTAKGRYRVTFTTSLDGTEYGLNCSAGLGSFNDNWLSVATIDRHVGYGLTTQRIDISISNNIDTSLYDPVWFSFELYDPSIQGGSGGGGGSGASSLGENSDVVIVGTPNDGQALAYDAASHKWKPQNIKLSAIDTTSASTDTVLTIGTDGVPAWKESTGGSGSSAPGAYRGAWANTSVTYRTLTAETGIPPGLAVAGTASGISIIDAADSGGGTLKAMTFIPTDNGNSANRQLQFSAIATLNFNTITIRYWTSGENNYDGTTIYVDGALVFTDKANRTGFREAVLTVTPGSHNIIVVYSSDSGSTNGFQNVRISKITIPTYDTSAFVIGDIVTHNGLDYYCTKTGTVEIPGKGPEWAQTTTTSPVSGLLVRGGNLIKTVKPTVSRNFGSLAAVFDDTNTIPLTLGRMYRIDLIMLSNSATAAGPRLCVSDSRNNYGYIYAFEAANNTTEKLTISAVNAGTATTVIQSGNASAALSGGQVYQAFIIPTPTGNQVWAKSTGGDTGTSLPDTSANFFTQGNLKVGYAGPADAYVIKVYDMGTLLDTSLSETSGFLVPQSVSARYWRVRGSVMSPESTANGWGVSDLRFEDESGITLMGMGNPFASEVDTTGPWSIAAAFNGVIEANNGWFGGNNRPHASLGYDFGVPVTVGFVSMVGLVSMEAWVLGTSLAVEYSEDGLTWVELQVTNTGAVAEGQRLTLRVRKPTVQTAQAVSVFAPGVPPLASFATNGSATVTEHPGRAYVATGLATTHKIFYKAAPMLASYRIVCAMSRTGYNNSARGGMLVRNGTDGGYFWANYDAENLSLSVQKFNSTGVLQTGQDIYTGAWFPSRVEWMAIRSDGTNFHFEISPDGVTFESAVSLPKGSFDQVGFGVCGSTAASLMVRCWDENGSSRQY